MHSSVERGRPSQVQANEVAALDLQLIRLPGRTITASNFRRLTVAGEVFADLLMINIAVRLGYLIYGVTAIGKHVHFPARLIWTVGAVIAAVMVLMLDRVGAYRRGNSLLRVRETEQILRVTAEALVTVLAVSFFAHILVPRWLWVICLSLIPVFLFVEKSFLYLLVRSLHSRGYGNERVLIYGAGCTGRRVFSVLRGSPKLGLVPVVVVDDDVTKVGGTLFEMAYERRSCARVVAGPVTRELLAMCSVDLIIIAIPSIGREKFTYTLAEALAANAKVSFVPSHFVPSDSWLDYRDIDGILLASLGTPIRRVAYDVAKRLCDVVGSLILMLMGAPFFIVLGLAIKFDSWGPVFFRQERIGQNGRRIRMYKFRTMRTKVSPYDYSPRASSDPRITRVGRFLRRTSLDELPQLLNVLQGNMSLVGPRPEMPFIVDQYTDRHRQRLQVKPGITGLWQLSGDRAFLIHENVEYDLYYIRHRNFFMDLAILLHTSAFAMRGI